MNENEKKEFEQVVEAVTSKVAPIVTEKTVDMLVEKFKNEKPLRKQIFGDGESSEKSELAEKKAIAAEYIKKLVRKEETKSLSSGSATNGSELVPTYVSDSVIGVAQKYGLIRSKAMQWPMQGILEDVPTVGTVQAYRLATDTTAMTASQPTTGAVKLSAKTIGVMIPISKTLLMNANPKLVDILTVLAGKAIAKLEDQWGLLGLAAGEGIFQNTNVPVYTLGSTNTTYAKATATDLLAVEDLVDENFIGDSMEWVMSRSVLNNFRKERAVVGSDKQGFLLPGYGENTPPTLWGYPYNTTAVMPKNSDESQAGKKFLALVDWSNIVFGDAMQYTMEISDQATITDVDGSTAINTFQQNMVALKIWGQVDIKLANAASAFGVLATAAS
ncbi:MAG TPA: phage major capsid protein [Chloroflexia bacterium]|nr:phage major capsid protein [Chloroflexia bacterium]